jgi:demethylmenaquinone methyltransferase/2-methoxy-6-polyprenyl-1,4-benzoquinol methylase
MRNSVKDKTHFGFKEVDSSEKQSHVKGVFSSVAENYDVMNDAMSMGMHRVWKKILVELSGISNREKVLDIASGTGDIAKLILNEYPETEVFMTDINMEMLGEGRDRSINESFGKNCHFCQLNGEILPFADKQFDVITIGFGLRNFTSKEAGIAEMSRCLKDDGRLLILEFSKPKNKTFSKIYDWYSFNILPKLGSILANDSDSYQYLAESIRMHPDQESLKDMVLESGFNNCKFYNLFNGIVAIHVANKN